MFLRARANGAPLLRPGPSAGISRAARHRIDGLWSLLEDREATIKSNEQTITRLAHVNRDLDKRHESDLAIIEQLSDRLADVASAGASVERDDLSGAEQRSAARASDIEAHRRREAELSEECKVLNEQVGDLRARADGLQRQLESQRSTISRLREANGSSSREAVQSRARAEDLLAEAADLRAQAESDAESRRGLEVQLARLQDDLAAVKGESQGQIQRLERESAEAQQRLCEAERTSRVKLADAEQHAIGERARLSAAVREAKARHGEAQQRATMVEETARIANERAEQVLIEARAKIETAGQEASARIETALDRAHRAEAAVISLKDELTEANAAESTARAVEAELTDLRATKAELVERLVEREADLDRAVSAGMTRAAETEELKRDIANAIDVAEVLREELAAKADELAQERDRGVAEQERVEEFRALARRYAQRTEQLEGETQELRSEIDHRVTAAFDSGSNAGSRAITQLDERERRIAVLERELASLLSAGLSPTDG